MVMIEIHPKKLILLNLWDEQSLPDLSYYYYCNIRTGLQYRGRRLEEGVLRF